MNSIWWINPTLTAGMAAWIIAQVLKVIFSAFRGKPDYHLLYLSGGMPSAHSAVVSSLATYLGIVSGISSPLFGLAAMLAIIVIYDSMGVRRSAGDQAVALNDLIKQVGSKSKLRIRHIREVMGHTPLEVAAGTFLGIAIAVLTWLIFGYIA